MSSVGLLFFIIIIILIIIISSHLQKEKNETNEPTDIELLGEIICTYDVQSISQNTILLGNEFKKESDFDIYVDNNKIKYSKDYLFNSTGNHEIQIKLYKEINMDYMFKDVQDLISIEMKSEKNCKIISMISTFENCKNLKNFNINGFNGNMLKSLHKMFKKWFN